MGSFKREYDEQGRETYTEYDNGHWERNEYDKKGRLTYCENSYGYCGRYEYDDYGRPTVTAGRKSDDALRQMTAEDKNHYIESIEFARDWGDEVSAADYQMYLDLIAERAAAASETAAHECAANEAAAELEEIEEAEI